MSHRRSERLRQKRLATPGLSQPGAYHLHDDGYVVESEASFLPSHNATPPPVLTNHNTPIHNSASPGRRIRFRHTQQRFTVDDSPVLPPDSRPSLPTSLNPNLHTPPPQRRVRPDSTERVVSRVRASLYDILGSATRRPVSPRWRPPPSVHPSDLRRPALPTAADDDYELDQPIPSDNEEEDGVPHDQPQPHSSIRRFPRNLLCGVSPPSIAFSPLRLCLLAFLLMSACILALDHAQARRHHRPPISNQALHYCQTTIRPLSSSVIVQPVLSTYHALVPTLPSTSSFRNVWRVFLSFFPTSSPSSENVSSNPIPPSILDPASVITRAQLEREIVPDLLRLARQAAVDAAEKTAAQLASLAKQPAEQPAPTDEFLAFVERFAADKDLPADFALASAGGAVISTEPSSLVLWTRFVRQYAASLVSDTLFTPTWPRPASIVLNPHVLPGNCWAFSGAQGSLTIRLARPVVVSAISIEHTPPRSVFSITSALRRFRVIGLPVGAEMAEVALGDFMFDLSSDSNRHLQTFDVVSVDAVLRAIRVEILSNHGANHTSIYRIRVHGHEQLTELVALDNREM